MKFVRVLYCKLPTNSKQLSAFLPEAMLGTKPQPQRWEARVLPLCHRGPLEIKLNEDHLAHLLMGNYEFHFILLLIKMRVQLINQTCRPTDNTFLTF